MAETLTHKIIIPVVRDVSLDQLVLCWNKGASTPDRSDPYPLTSTSINEVDCPFCWDIWLNGQYS